MASKRKRKVSRPSGQAPKRARPKKIIVSSRNKITKAANRPVTKARQIVKAPRRIASRAKKPVKITKTKKSIAKTPVRKVARAKAPKKITLTKAQKQQTRSFKKDVSTLKKLGIAFKGRDIRKVKQDKKTKSVLRRFREVLEGKKKAYKLPKKEAAAFKKAGYEVKDDVLLLKKQKGETIKRDRRGIVKKRKMKGGSIETLVLPVEYKNLRQYLSDAYNDPELQQLRMEGGKFAFRFFGNNSLATFESLDTMLEYLGYYDSVQEAIKSGKPSEMLEVYRNVEIVTVKSTRAWASNTKEREDAGDGWTRRPIQGRRERDRRSYWQMKNRNPSRHEYQQERRRKNAKRWYDARKKDPEFLKKRAAQRRADRKKGGG